MSHEDDTEGHEPITWHHGLMARWWAEFNEAEPNELAFYQGAIERFGEPALDLACGAGRLLVPLKEAGLDVDGADVSPDMLAQARRLAAARGLNPTLTEQPISGLDLARRYRTIFICDSFGIGGPRNDDLEGLRRVHAHLVPGGALVLSHHLPYGEEEGEWLRWLPYRHGDTESWPETGDRRTAADGDELELTFRERSWDPLLQRSVLEMRARLWRDDRLVREEEQAIVLSAYFAQEIVTMLEVAGFIDVEVQRAYTGEPASSDDTHVVFIARRPA
jgi:SAM-dependent methyltransferase